MRTALNEHYDDYYQGESEWRAVSSVDKARNVVRLCSRYPHRTILDIGSGEGAVLQRLAEKGFGERIVSAEVSRSGLQAIRAKNIPTLQAVLPFDGYRLPFRDDAFDLAILSHVVEHVEHPRKLLFEAGRVAQYVFVEVPLELTVRLPRDYRWNSVGHLDVYSPKTIRRLLQTCELRVLGQVVTNVSYPVYRYRSKRMRWLRYIVKQAALRLSPSIAPSLFVYHSALITESQRQIGTTVPHQPVSP